MLENEKLYLRKPEPEDLEFLYTIENNTEFWQVSETKCPYSKWQLKQHIEDSIFDIYTNKELRLIIHSKEKNKSIGIIDLFDFDPCNKRVGIGIIIEKEEQNKKFASQSLLLTINYTFNTLNINQIWCLIGLNNAYSIKLFENFGFLNIGILKEWKCINNVFYDVAMYQLLAQKKQ